MPIAYIPGTPGFERASQLDHVHEALYFLPIRAPVPIGTKAAHPWLGKTMLRAEMQDSEKDLVIRLEGRFAGEDAEQVRMLVTRRNIEGRLVVDLTEVTFIDSAGEATLSFFSRLGAKFVAEDVYVLYVCRRLNLPLLARNRKRGKAAPLVNASRAADQG
jgi:hypothetical protein